MKIPTFEDIQQAHERIKPYVHCTPVLKSEGLNSKFGCEMFFKCENFQKVGAFKYRGASNALETLTKEEKGRGVITHSSGNHAQALALAAKIRSVKATIVMPENAPSVKVEAVKEYGANIVFCKPTLKSRETAAEKIIQETGATFIHPYNNFNIICGQGTAAKEFLEEKPDLDYFIVPVGGGALLSGSSIAAKAIKNKIKVLGAEPAMADDAYQSLKAGKIIPSIQPKTICDGLLTSLGTLTFEVINKHVDDIITVSEESIITAMRLIWERMKIIAEPSACVTLAVILENPGEFAGKKIGCILSGGNVDLKRLPF